jgi:hypothetical protein
MIGGLHADDPGMEVEHELTMLHRAGYRPVRPVGDIRIDARTARDATCERCGRRGLRFAALARPEAIGHVALAWCPDCFEATEL